MFLDLFIVLVVFFVRKLDEDIIVVFIGWVAERYVVFMEEIADMSDERYVFISMVRS